VFCNVLVGVDGSAGADQALAQAIAIARISGSRMGVLGVVPAVNPWVASTPFALPVSRAQLTADVEAETCRHVEEAVRAIPQDVPVTKLMARGNAAEALLTQALDGPWDLLVVGRGSAFARRSRLRRTRSSPVPVLTVPAASSWARHRVAEPARAYPGDAEAARWPPGSTVSSV
jgi:nucleotide-binding universal stress UspA family protein